MAGLVPAIRVFFDGRFAGSISCLQRNAWKKDVGGQSKSGRDDHLDSSRAITCSRVTDGNPSSIDGKISSQIQGANLFFINPAGVMFGPHAQLDVSGSFAVTTANYLKLVDGGRFNANLGGGAAHHHGLGVEAALVQQATPIVELAEDIDVAVGGAGAIVFE